MSNVGQLGRMMEKTTENGEGDTSSRSATTLLIKPTSNGTMNVKSTKTERCGVLYHVIVILLSLHLSCRPNCG